MEIFFIFKIIFPLILSRVSGQTEKFRIESNQVQLKRNPSLKIDFDFRHKVLILIT